MSATTTPVRAALRADRAAAPRRGWDGALAAVLRAIEGRRLLAQMDDRMLADIGASRGEALREAARAPWDIGPSRRG